MFMLRVCLWIRFYASIWGVFQRFLAGLLQQTLLYNYPTHSKPELHRGDLSFVAHMTIAVGLPPFSALTSARPFALTYFSLPPVVGVSGGGACPMPCLGQPQWARDEAGAWNEAEEGGGGRHHPCPPELATHCHCTGRSNRKSGLVLQGNSKGVYSKSNIGVTLLLVCKS